MILFSLVSCPDFEFFPRGEHFITQGAAVFEDQAEIIRVEKANGKFI